MRQIDRRLPPKRKHDAACARCPVRRLDLVGAGRFEIEPVRYVEIGRNGLGIVVDHDRFITRLAQRQLA